MGAVLLLFRAVVCRPQQLRGAWAYVLRSVATFGALLMIHNEASAGKRKRSDSPLSTLAPVQRLTTLRASPPSFLVGGRGGTQEVRYISVEVANVGTVEASGIQVSIPGGAALSFPLRGPKKLGVGMRGTYVSTVRVPVGVSLQPHAIATCSTCRR